MVLWLLLMVTSAYALLEDCPAASCAGLGYDVCASFDGQQLYFNSGNCTEGMHCSLYATMQWVQLRTSAGDEKGTLYCQETGFVPKEALYDASEVTCGVRDMGQRLKEGAYPKTCASETDCALSNGDFGNCVCGLDGKSYCEAYWGAPVMDSFWTECNNSTNLIAAPRYEYWREYLHAYVFSTTKPPCAGGLFDEFQYLASDVSLADCLLVSLSLLV